MLHTIQALFEGSDVVVNLPNITRMSTGRLMELEQHQLRCTRLRPFDSA